MSNSETRLTQAQYEMLRSLKNGNTISEAASELGIKTSTAASRANTLIEKGFVTVSGTRKSGGRGRPSNVFSVGADLRTLKPRA